MATQLLFNQVALIGVGLMGSSLARAMREHKLASSIAGYDSNPEALARAEEIGVIDSAAINCAAAVADADLVVVATPLGAVSSVFEQIEAHAAPGAIIIDVGSTKGSVVAAAANGRNDIFIVPCHPVAGTEQSGPDAGFAALFKDRWCIMTPLERDDPEYLVSVEKIAALWRGAGCHVEMMDAGHHDLALAITSHLPHLIAFTLVGAADDLENVSEAEIIKYSAGGFRDFTRIAASDPVMWRDVFLNNKEAVLEVLGRFTEELSLLQRAIRWSDGEALEKIFARGSTIRRAIVDAGQEMDAPNFGRDEPH